VWAQSRFGEKAAAMADYAAEMIIAGTGLATAYDLLEHGQKVLVLDKDSGARRGPRLLEFWRHLHGRHAPVAPDRKSS